MAEEEREETVLLFTNKKAGGNKGEVVANAYRKILPLDQVYEIPEQNPVEALRSWIGRGGVKRLIVCGGDGTMGWLFNCIDEIEGEEGEFLVAMMPLGTGNDLSRTFKWGPQYSPKFLEPEYLEKVRRAKPAVLDRWLIAVMPDDPDPEGHLPFPFGFNKRQFSHELYLAEEGEGGEGSGGGGEAKDPDGGETLPPRALSLTRQPSSTLVRDRLASFDSTRSGPDGGGPSGSLRARRRTSILLEKGHTRHTEGVDGRAKDMVQAMALGLDEGGGGGGGRGGSGSPPPQRNARPRPHGLPTLAEEGQEGEEEGGGRSSPSPPKRSSVRAKQKSFNKSKLTTLEEASVVVEATATAAAAEGEERRPWWSQLFSYCAQQDAADEGGGAGGRGGQAREGAARAEGTAAGARRSPTPARGRRASGGGGGGAGTPGPAAEYLDGAASHLAELGSEYQATLGSASPRSYSAREEALCGGYCCTLEEGEEGGGGGGGDGPGPRGGPAAEEDELGGGVVSGAKRDKYAATKDSKASGSVKNPNAISLKEHPKPMSRGNSVYLQTWLSFDSLFINYFSIGVDAAAAIAFDRRRTAHPEEFTSPLKNKLMYVRYGTPAAGGACCCGARPPLRLNDYCDIEILEPGAQEFTKLAVPGGCRGLIALNIRSYAGGHNLWGKKGGGRRGFRAQDAGDGLIELVGVQSIVRLGLTLGLNRMGATARRLAQCRELRVHARAPPDRPMALQIDGEPWESKACTIHIKRFSTSPVLNAKGV